MPDPPDLTTVKSVLRGCLVSYPSQQRTVQELNYDYKDQEGTFIPFRELGFSSNIEFLRSISDTVLVCESYGQTVIKPVGSNKTAHLESLVQRQNSKIKKRPMKARRYPQPVFMPANRPYTSSYSSQGSTYQRRYSSGSGNPPLFSRPPTPSLFTLPAHYPSQYSAPKGGFGPSHGAADFPQSSQSSASSKPRVEAKVERPPVFIPAVLQQRIIQFVKEEPGIPLKTLEKKLGLDAQNMVVYESFERIMSAMAHSVEVDYRDKVFILASKLQDVASTSYSQAAAKHTVNERIPAGYEDTDSEDDIMQDLHYDETSYSRPAATHQKTKMYYKATGNNSSRQQKTTPVARGRARTTVTYANGSATPTCVNGTSPVEYSNAQAYPDEPLPAPRPTEERLAARPAEPQYSDDEPLVCSAMSDKLKLRITQLLEKHPGGIWCSQLPDKYLEAYGSPLNFQEIGYVSTVQMLSSAPDLFVCVQDNNADWKVRDVRDYDTDPFVPPEILGRIEELLRRTAGGIHIDEFADAYERMFSTEFSMRDMGFSSVDDLFASLDGSSVRRRAVGDRYRLYPAPVTAPSAAPRPEPPILLYTKDDPSIRQYFGNEVAGPDFELPRLELPESIVPTSYMEIIVAAIFSPDNFFVQYRMLGFGKQVDLVMDDMYKFYTREAINYRMPPAAMVPAIYCACFTEYEYHRCLIMSVSIDDTVMVRLVDFGNCKRVNKNMVYFLHMDFAALPAQAIACRCANICPADNKPAFSRESGERLLQLVEDRGLMAIIAQIDRKRLCLSASLVDTNGFDDIHINDLLVVEGYAAFRQDEKDMDLGRYRELMNERATQNQQDDCIEHNQKPNSDCEEDQEEQEENEKKESPPMSPAQEFQTEFLAQITRRLQTASAEPQAEAPTSYPPLPEPAPTAAPYMAAPRPIRPPPGFSALPTAAPSGSQWPRQSGLVVPSLRSVQAASGSTNKPRATNYGPFGMPSTMKIPYAKGIDLYAVAAETTAAANDLLAYAEAEESYATTMDLAAYAGADLPRVSRPGAGADAELSRLVAAMSESKLAATRCTSLGRASASIEESPAPEAGLTSHNLNARQVALEVPSGDSFSLNPPHLTFLGNTVNTSRSSAAPSPLSTLSNASQPLSPLPPPTPPLPLNPLANASAPQTPLTLPTTPVPLNPLSRLFQPQTPSPSSTTALPVNSQLPKPPLKYSSPIPVQALFAQPFVPQVPAKPVVSQPNPYSQLHNPQMASQPNRYSQPLNPQPIAQPNPYAQPFNPQPIAQPNPYAQPFNPQPMTQPNPYPQTFNPYQSNPYSQLPRQLTPFLQTQNVYPPFSYDLPRPPMNVYPAAPNPYSPPPQTYVTPASQMAMNYQSFLSQLAGLPVRYRLPSGALPRPAPYHPAPSCYNGVTSVGAPGTERRGGGDGMHAAVTCETQTSHEDDSIEKVSVVRADADGSCESEEKLPGEGAAQSQDEDSIEDVASVKAVIESEKTETDGVGSLTATFLSRVGNRPTTNGHDGVSRTATPDGANEGSAAVEASEPRIAGAERISESEGSLLNLSKDSMEESSGSVVQAALVHSIQQIVIGGRVVHLFDVGGLPHLEVDEVVGMSEIRPTVAVKILRAKHVHRKFIEVRRTTHAQLFEQMASLKIFKCGTTAAPPAKLQLVALADVPKVLAVVNVTSDVHLQDIQFQLDSFGSR